MWERTNHALMRVRSASKTNASARAPPPGSVGRSSILQLHAKSRRRRVRASCAGLRTLTLLHQSRARTPMRTSTINPSSHSWRALAAVFALLGTTAPSGPAAAQTIGGARDASTAVEDAHNHFALGVKLYTEGDFGPALVQFQRAQEIKPHYKVLYN